MITIDFHDANVNDPVVGKMKAPTHTGTARVDYEYQAEQHVIDAEKDFPHIVRIVLDGGRREWRRVGGRFVESLTTRRGGTKECLECGLFVDSDWVENPTNDYACDRKNVPHQWAPLFWVRNVPGDRVSTPRRSGARNG